MISYSPAYLLNALAVDFNSIYAMEDKVISSVFHLIDSSELRYFLSAPSLDIYETELLTIYEKRLVDVEGNLF